VLLVYLHRGGSDKWFYWSCDALLTVAGLKLLIEGATGLMS